MATLLSTGATALRMAAIATAIGVSIDPVCACIALLTLAVTIADMHQ